jgi:hypothetical protein
VIERVQKIQKNRFKAMTSSLPLFAPRSIWLPHVIGKESFLFNVASCKSPERCEKIMSLARQPGPTYVSPFCYLRTRSADASSNANNTIFFSLWCQLQFSIKAAIVTSWVLPSREQVLLWWSAHYANSFLCELALFPRRNL